MPFQKGNKLGHGRPKKDTPKTIWLLESLAANGVDLQSLLAQSILKAAKGDKQALDLAHLLQKMLPLVANAPKQDLGINQIETLVINRYDVKRIDSSPINTSIVDDINRFDAKTPSKQIDTVIDTSLEPTKEPS